MEILGEFFERGIDEAQGDEGGEVLYKVRKAVRAVIFNSEKEIAFLFASKKNYHKLPGGGVEKDENLETALRREIREEVGYDVKVRPQEVGAIIEYRDSEQLLQISYCYITDVAGRPAETSLTDEEKERGLQPEWMDIDEAIEALKKDNPSDTVGKFIARRDLLFLQKAKEILGK